MAITKPRKPRVVLPSNDAGFEANQYGVFSDIRNMVDDLGLMSDDLGEFAESINNYEVYATSTTSNTVSNGTKTFTVEANKGYLAGMVLAAVPNANPLVEIKGRVQSYNIATGALVLDSGSVGFGSGTYAAWKIYPTIIANTGDFQANKFTKVITTGTGTAYVATLASNLVAMEDGIELDITFHADCTAAPTLALNGFAPLNLVARNLTDGSVANLSAGAVTNGFSTKIRSQGSNWVCDEVLETSTFVELTANTTLTSANTLGKVLNLNFEGGVYTLPALSTFKDGQAIDFVFIKNGRFQAAAQETISDCGVDILYSSTYGASTLYMHYGCSGQIIKYGNKFLAVYSKVPRKFRHPYNSVITLNIGDTVYYSSDTLGTLTSLPLKIGTNRHHDNTVGISYSKIFKYQIRLTGSFLTVPTYTNGLRLLPNGAAGGGGGNIVMTNQHLTQATTTVSAGTMANTNSIVLAPPNGVLTSALPVNPAPHSVGSIVCDLSFGSINGSSVQHISAVTHFVGKNTSNLRTSSTISTAGEADIGMLVSIGNDIGTIDFDNIGLAIFYCEVTRIA